MIRQSDSDLVTYDKWQQEIVDLLDESNADAILDAVLPIDQRFTRLRELVEQARPACFDLHRRWIESAAMLSSLVNEQIYHSLFNAADGIRGAVREARDLLADLGRTPPGSPAWSDRQRRATDKLTAILSDFRGRLPALVAVTTLAILEAKSSELSEVNREWKDLSESSAEFADTMSELTAKQRALEQFLDRASKTAARTAFADRSRSHGWAQWSWGIGTVVASGVAIKFGLIVWAAELAADATLAQITAFTLKHTALLAASSVLLRLTLKRWSLERNLKIIYEHRLAALNQFELFAASMSDAEREAREALRLRLAELMFADPATGYRDDNSTELNLSPVVTIAEGIAKRSSN